MTFEQLEYFIAVVENDTFFDAADVLHISQSSLSKRIMKLEKELDIKLLDRSRRNAALTEAGEAFYHEALSLVEEYHRTLGKLEKYKENNTKQIRIGTLPILTQYHLTARLRDFSRLYPEIHLDLDEVEEPELLNGLESGRYDFIIARENLVQAAKYKSYTLMEDELVIVLAHDHPLINPAGSNLSEKQSCKNCSLQLTDLADEKFILMNRHTSIYKLCMEQFANAGIKANIVRNARIESIISAVSVGEGISLLPKNNFNVFHHENVVTLPLSPSVHVPVVLVRKKGGEMSPSCKMFVRYFHTCDVKSRG
ncbi:LysR family transcriptional regulator [Blautia schinkii]|nr:LysR family transcriptional regulator [Blautia schinkii]